MAVQSRKRHVDKRSTAQREASESVSERSASERHLADQPSSAEALVEPAEAETSETPSSVPPPPAEANLRRLYDHLVPHLGRWRAEVIDGRLVVSPVGSPENQWKASVLVEAFLPFARERGWRVYPGLDVCLPGTREPFEPDFAMAPKDAPRWGEREVFTDGLVMVGEIVSPASVEDDREKKPRIYARGRVPIMLLVDPVCDPPTVTVFSRLKDGKYTEKTEVAMGEKLHLPEPVDFTLDTAIFLD
jgi:Uma2 family endonuclease